MNKNISNIQQAADDLEEHADLVENYVRASLVGFIENSTQTLCQNQIKLLGVFSAFLVSGSKIENIDELYKVFPQTEEQGKQKTTADVLSFLKNTKLGIDITWAYNNSDDVLEVSLFDLIKNGIKVSLAEFVLDVRDTNEEIEEKIAKLFL